MPQTFKKRIQISFGISLFILVVSSTVSYISIRNLLKSADLVDHTHVVISRLENINQMLQEAESGQRGFLLANDSSFVSNLESLADRIRGEISEVRAQTADNPVQQESISRLSAETEERIALLINLVKMKNEGREITREQLLAGRNHMLSVRKIIDTMEATEQNLLRQRTGALKEFSVYTSSLVVLAALISLFIAGYFYNKIIADYKVRVRLQKELEEKDIEIRKRLGIIQSIADKVSNGNYRIRVDDAGRDVLGTLAGSLNKMAESLDYSFGLLSEKEWLQTGAAELNQKMLGEQDIGALAEKMLTFIVNYTGSSIGAMYLSDGQDALELIGSHGLKKDIPARLETGEGVAGQCAKEKRMLVVEDISEQAFVVTLAAGDVKPVMAVAIPVTFEGVVKGVIEIGATKKYSKKVLTFLEAVSERAGIAINTSQDRRKLQELLEETQSQAEELQAQHAELENINEELRLQSQKLQVSEEELKVQQEELMQTNMELEERTTLLEEKNQLIADRTHEIQEKARELAISTRYKSEFLANMSHELRTPLNSILLLSRLMLEEAGGLSAEQSEYLRVILSSGQGLLSLIDEILDLSKVEAGKMNLDYDNAVVKEIVTDIKALFGPIAKEKNIGFEADYARDVPAVFETDRMRLDQVLKNLISNAIKFTSQGKVSLSISRHVEERDMLVFAVKDTGIGIAPEHQAQVFEAFRQADGSTRRQFGGTGLGLSISREISRLLGGRIELQSDPGHGSEFRLIVPMSRPAEGPGKKHEDKLIDEIIAAPVTDPGLDAATGGARRVERSEVLITEDDTADKMSEVIHRIEHGLRKEPRKVLIVEENSRHAKALAYFLENFSISVTIRNSPEDSVSELQQRDGVCVIMDAGVTGAKLHDQLERVKSEPGLENLPIIIFTGKALSRQEEMRMKQFANSIVLKTAHSYQRILDEVSLFLHISSDREEARPQSTAYKKLGRLTEVLSGKKVLIADDDVRNIFSLSKALESYGMEIISAVDGRDALEQLRKNPSPDIVLMDIMMPEMDGYETMKAIRREQRYSRLPIIAVTAKAMAGDREKCISAGASDYITKPIDKDQLLSLLRVWLYDKP